jgi:hypothetical protein
MKVTEKDDAKKATAAATDLSKDKEQTKEVVKEVKDADTLTFEGIPPPQLHFFVIYFDSF